MSSEYVAKKDTSQSGVEPGIEHKKRVREPSQRSDEEVVDDPAPKRPIIQELPIESPAPQVSNLSATISTTILNLVRKKILDLLQQNRQEDLVTAFRYKPYNKLTALQYCASLIRGEISLPDFVTSWKNLCEEEVAAKRAAQVEWDQMLDSMAEAPAKLESIGTLTTFFALMRGRADASKLEDILVAHEEDLRAVETVLQEQVKQMMDDFFSRSAVLTLGK